MTAVVTGAGGFIATTLVRLLVERGTHVRAFVHYRVDGTRGLLDLLPTDVVDSIDVVTGDLRDADTVRRAIRGSTEVFHLGASVGIPYSYRSPRDVVETNVIGTLNILEAARDTEGVRVIHTSTSEVYGSAQSVPMDEMHPLTGQSPYAASKIGADNIAISFHRSFGLPVSIARPFNTFGPGQTARAIVPTVISQAVAGSRLKLGALTPTRDLTFVDDTARAFVAIAETDAAIGEVYNIGTGIETSVATIVDIVGELIARPLDVVTDEQRVRPAASEVDRLCADASRLRRTCGWEPTIALRDGIARTIEWIEAHLDRFRPDVYAI